MSEPRILLVGNPNSGKTTLFNALTGANQTVGNWPGVTVERREGLMQMSNSSLTIVDIPGVYSLDIFDGTGSLDEGVARNAVSQGAYDLILNVIDASNLERNLYLTLQLTELGRPMVLVLNMMDAAEEAGFIINKESLAQELRLPVVTIVASRSRGLDVLKAALQEQLKREHVSHPLQVAYAAPLEAALKSIEVHLEQEERTAVSLRAQALALLERAIENPHGESDVVRKTVADLRAALPDDLDIMVADARYTRIRSIIESAVTRARDLSISLTERLDRIVLNRWLGIPVFLFAMYLLFFLTISMGGAFVDFFDGVANTLFVAGPRAWLAPLDLPQWLLALLLDGAGKGLQTVATFIPTIAVLFLFLSFLEDSGYMARAAFVMDRFMRAIGLPGKAFVPLIVGFGCNVPAIMSTRTLENPRDRLLTILISPFMSCSARLPVYAILTAAFFPRSGQNVVFSLYIIGILVAVGTGFLMRRSLLAGSNSSFVMELPPYHIPTLRSMALRTWEKLKGFIIRAGKVIVAMVAVLGVLGAIDTSGHIGNTNPEASLLSALGKSITPIFAPIGITQENWPATVGLITGVFAKEVVVGTMNPLYERLGGEINQTQIVEFSFTSSLKEAFLTIPTNLVGLAGALADPLGLATVSSTKNGAVAQSEMQRRFATPWAAYAFLLFVLLYTPCVSVIGAIYRETNMRWTLFSVVWTTGIAYWVAALFFQASRLATAPASALMGLATLALAFVVALALLLRRKRNDTHRNSELCPPTAGRITP